MTPSVTIQRSSKVAGLTDARILRLEKPERGKRLLFDDHRDAPRGFGIRVTAGGKRTFVFRYRSDAGRDRLMVIGDYPT